MKAVDMIHGPVSGITKNRIAPGPVMSIMRITKGIVGPVSGIMKDRTIEIDTKVKKNTRAGLGSTI